jgi:hypothetical protein
MTIQDLLDELEQLLDGIDGLDPQTEVRLAIQPSWPLQFEIASVVEFDPTAEYDEPEPEEGRGPDEEKVVYITQGDHPSGRNAYAPEGLRW